MRADNARQLDSRHSPPTWCFSGAWDLVLGISSRLASALGICAKPVKRIFHKKMSSDVVPCPLVSSGVTSILTATH
jgi:hypothetical protein